MVKLRLKELLAERERSIYWLNQVSGVRYATLLAWTKTTPKEIKVAALEKVCLALDCQVHDLIQIVRQPKQRKVTLK